MEIDDEIIIKMENFVQQKLSKQFNEANATDNLTDFYGAFHAHNPNGFVFHIGDKILIKQLAAHVKQIYEKDHDFNHFQNESKIKETFMNKMTMKTSLGLYFGTNNKEGCRKKATNESKKNFHEMLYQKTKKLLEVGIHSEMASKFQRTMVIINSSGESITGHVVCVYCEKQKQVFFDSTYWVLSNLGKHLKLCAKKPGDTKKHEKQKKRGELKVHENSKKHEKLKMHEVSQDEVVEEFIDDSDDDVIEESMENSFDEDIKSDNDDTEVSDESNNKSVLNITSLDENENFIYFQICEQIQNMRSTSLKNQEEEHDLPVMIENGVHGKIGICLIEPDGNCLVSSLAHQLFRHKLDSSEHIEATKTLRMDVVAHVKQNLETFESHLVWRDDFDKVAVGDNMQSKIDYFLEKLSTQGFWCGTEAIIAASRLYLVNIIIINEEGTSYMVDKFNLNYKTCAIVVYCAYGSNRKAKNKTKNHYNSAIKIDRKEIFSCMKKIISCSGGNEIAESITLE